MFFGYPHRLAKVDFQACMQACTCDSQRDTINCAEIFYNDFKEVWAIIKRLDATRPVPTFTSIGASPTVTATLQDMGLNANHGTVRVCPMEFKKVEVVNPKTKQVEIHTVCRLLWPAGTRHNQSRFSGDSCHCHACGHSIKNPFNWVPMLVDDKAGTPHSLWVGRDCAKTIFGVDMTGELEIEGR
jgi:hypothetical protein